MLRNECGIRTLQRAGVTGSTQIQKSWSKIAAWNWSGIQLGLFKAILGVADLSLAVRSGLSLLIHVDEYKFVD